MVGLSVVIPTFRGAPESVVEGLRGVLGDRPFELVVVDDGSGSPWSERIAGLVADYPESRLITLSERGGQAHATLVGVAVARGRVVVTMDDDGDHPPEAVPGLVSRLEEGFDLVYGVPRQPHRRGLRRLGTGLNNALFTLCLSKPLRVPVTSFRAIRRDLLTTALRAPVRFGYLSAMLFSAGARRGGARAGVYYYRRPEKASPDRRRSRYGLLSLLRVYWKLVLHWGPLRPLSTLSGLPKKRFG